LGLNAKLIIPFVSILSLAVALLGEIFIHAQSAALSRSLEKKAEVLAQNLAIALNDPLSMGEYDHVQRIVDEAKKVDEDVVYALVVGMDGRGIASTDPALRNQTLTHSEFESSALTVSDFTRRDTSIPGLFEVVMPIRFQASHVAVLRIGVSAQQIVASARKAGWTFIGVGALALLLGVTIYLYLTRLITKPLHAAVERLQKLAAGGTDLRVCLKSLRRARQLGYHRGHGTPNTVSDRPQ